MFTHCTENSKINDEMDGVEVINLCSESQTKNSELHEGKETTKQESQDKMKSNAIAKMESNPNLTPSGCPTKLWGLCGEVAHIAQQNFVIGQFAKTKSFHWSRCPW